MVLIKVPFYSQSNRYNCAPASTRSVLAFYGIDKTEKELVSLMKTDENKGTNPLSLINGLKKIGIETEYIHKHGYDKEIITLKGYLDTNTPVIISLNMNSYKQNIANVQDKVSWQGNGFTFHYVVLVGYDEKYFYILDNAEKVEANGIIILSNNEFKKAWYNEYLFGDIFILKLN